MFGTFTRDGRTRVAQSRAEAVRLRFDGWREEQPGELRGAALDAALDAAGLSRGGSAAEKRARLAESTVPVAPPVPIPEP